MTDTEIKKQLYKQKPIAQLEFVRKGIMYYTAVLKSENGIDSEMVRFNVPVFDIGDADYTPHMEAKLLIRYLA